MTDPLDIYLQSLRFSLQCGSLCYLLIMLSTRILVMIPRDNLGYHRTGGGGKRPVGREWEASSVLIPAIHGTPFRGFSVLLQQSRTCLHGVMLKHEENFQKSFLCVNTIYIYIYKKTKRGPFSLQKTKIRGTACSLDAFSGLISIQSRFNAFLLSFLYYTCAKCYDFKGNEILRKQICRSELTAT
jgi:hypothetical protein